MVSKAKMKFEFDFLSEILETLPKDIKILDVGCGYGKKLIYLHNRGYNICGVEKKVSTVEQVRKQGYLVYTLEEFNQCLDKQFDLIIFSHIIEHFDHDSLMKFLEYYLNYLDDDGYVLIYTPSFGKHFYEDFDHVKPYSPSGLKTVFGGTGAQVQYTSKYVLKIVNFDYRKEPYRITCSRKQILGETDYLALSINCISGVLFRISFRVLSKTTGWAALFKKVKGQDQVM